MPKTTKHLRDAGYQFKPGQSGNPEGGRAHNPIKKAMKKLTQKSFKKIVVAVCTGNLDELRRIAQNPNTPALQVGVANALMRAIREGDFDKLRGIITDVVGKVPEKLEISATTKSLNAHVNVTLDPELMRRALLELEGKV